MGHWWIENETYPLKILKKLKLTLEENSFVLSISFTWENYSYGCILY